MKRQYRKERIGRVILKLESPADECRYCTLPRTVKYDILFNWLSWYQVLKLRHRRFGTISHGMAMTVR
jgi:hypothetical protein